MINRQIIIQIILVSFIYAECSDLNYNECLQWPDYCEWNEETEQCQDIGGGNDDFEYGPYQFDNITEADGLRNGPEYDYAKLYYPIDGDSPYKSIIMTPGFGDDGSYIDIWGQFYASYGFIAMIIGPNDPMNDTWEARGLGLLDAIETVKQENNRDDSPLYNMIDINSFAVSGYSMGGGASQVAATLDNSIKAAIALNPMLLFYDPENCVPDDYCLLPEQLNHPVPVLIIAGQNELDELPDYECCWGPVQYDYTPNSNDKILFEIENGSHGSAAEPVGEVSDIILNWLKYKLLDDNLYCESLLESPSGASQYLSTIECFDELLGDVNEDSFIDILDVILTVNLILNNAYNHLADINFDNTIDILDIVQIINIILY